MTTNNYMDLEYSAEKIRSHFPISDVLLRDLLNLALSKGGDYCDLFFEYSIDHSVELEDGIANKANTNIDLGLGVRVLKGDQTGYCFTEDLSEEAMKNAARTAASIANDKAKFPSLDFTVKKHPNYFDINKAWDLVDIQEKIPYLLDINEKINALDERVVKCRAYIYDKTRYIFFANSEGRTFTDYLPMFLIGANCTAQQNGRTERNGHSVSLRKGFEVVTPDLIERICKTTVEKTVNLFEAGTIKAGEMEVVLAAGGAGILLHEAIGHGMEADFNRKNVSIFSDKMGRKVAESFVTIVDSGIWPNQRGTINIDDEGNDSQETVLVENGVLRSYMHDRLSASFYKLEPTGNGRRQSFRHVPMPRMRNTYMLNGPHEKDEIIACVKNGILAVDFTNGQVQIGAGDFTFYVKSGFAIENGKITHAIKDINIIGNGPDVLSKITMVANDLEISDGGWTCGKDGQSVPVSQGMPTVKVSKMTVGGM